LVTAETFRETATMLSQYRVVPNQDFNVSVYFEVYNAVKFHCILQKTMVKFERPSRFSKAL